MTLQTKPNQSNGSIHTSQKPKKAHRVWLKVSSIAISWCITNFCHSLTVNKEYYLEVMRQLREAIRQKRTELIIDFAP